MFHRVRHRGVSLLVLASYLAAGTMGMLWHEHLHDHVSGETCRHERAAEHCVHEDDADHGHTALADENHEQHDHEDHSHGEHEYSQHDTVVHDDDCSVCRLISQRTLAADPVTPAGCSQICETLAPLACPSPALAVPGIAHSRAPPAVG